jgi:hypothetical protein
MALCGAEASTLFLSCGTGLAGGFVHQGKLCSGVLELGKLVVGIRKAETGVAGYVPKHDILDVEGVAQGLACTQRSVFNVLRQRTGEIVTDKAEQRSTLIAMQKSFDDNAAFNTEVGGVAAFNTEVGAAPYSLSLDSPHSALMTLTLTTRYTHRQVFEELGDWLAQFVSEFSAYVDVAVEQVGLARTHTPVTTCSREHYCFSIPVLHAVALLLPLAGLY